MDSRIERLVRDNPNLSNAVIGRITGLTRKQVFSYRRKNQIKPNWFHKGKGVPFTSRFIVDQSTIAWIIECKGSVITSSSSFINVLENVDRVIYCLENNSGQLPPTRKESYFLGLGFGERL